MPVLVTARSAKLATPFTVTALVVPRSVPPPGLLPNAIVTVSVKPGTGFPTASRAVTRTAGVSGWPATVVVGCTVKPSRVAGPGVTSNAALETGPIPEAVATSV